MNKLLILCILLIFSCESKKGQAFAIITVPQGQIKLELLNDIAPKHVANFIKLSENSFYDGTTFHRVERGYLIQGGDLKSKRSPVYDDGTGQLDYTIESEAKLNHFKGAVAMAKKPLSSNPENRSNGSQFYIALDSLKHLDAEKYSIFAKVISGFDVIEKMTDLELVYDMNPNTNWEKKTEMSIEIIYQEKSNN